MSGDLGPASRLAEEQAQEIARQRAVIADAEVERERFYALFLQAPAVICVLRGPDHAVELANRPFLDLIGGGDVVGKPLREALQAEGGRELLGRLDSVYATGTPFVGRDVLADIGRRGRGDGGEGHFDFVYQPLVDAGGRVVGIMMHAVDVTAKVRARKDAEEHAEELARVIAELERSNRELDEFAYVVSHDIKAPLRGIASVCEWLEEDLAASMSDETRKHLGLVLGRVGRLGALVDGILAFSRVGRKKAQPETVDIGALVRDVVELLHVPAGAIIEIAPGMPVARVQRQLLGQVFSNLVGNAIKFARRADPRVRIGVSETGRFHELSVSDNGPGIAPQNRDRIWGLFQRLESRDTIEGAGIGLALVKKIVESQGGRVWVESSPEGGATFRFLWPIAPILR